MVNQPTVAINTPIQGPTGVLPPIKPSSSVSKSARVETEAKDMSKMTKRKKSANTITYTNNSSNNNNVHASIAKRKNSNVSISKTAEFPMASRARARTEESVPTATNQLTLSRIVDLVSSYLVQNKQLGTMISNEEKDLKSRTKLQKSFEAMNKSDLLNTKENIMNSIPCQASTATNSAIGAASTGCNEIKDQDTLDSHLTPNVLSRSSSALVPLSGSVSPTASITPTSSAASTVSSLFQKNKKQISQRGFERGVGVGGAPEMIAIHAIDTAEKYTTTSDFEEYYVAYSNAAEKGIITASSSTAPTLPRNSSQENICNISCNGSDGVRYVQNISSVPIPVIYKRNQSVKATNEQQQTLLRQQSMRNDRPTTVSTTTLGRANSNRMLNRP